MVMHVSINRFQNEEISHEGSSEGTIMKIPFYKPSSDYLTELVRIYMSERDQDPHPAGSMWIKMVRAVEAAHREERAKA